MTQPPAPFPWIKKIALQLENQIPLLGNAPPFDWHRFSSLISSRFGIHDLSIQETGRKWCSSEELQRGVVIPIRMSPIGSGLFWIMSENEARKLATHLLRGQSRGPLLPSDFADGFYRYLLLQGIDCLHGVDPFQKFSFEMDLEGSLPNEDLLTIDVEITVDGSSSFATLAMNPAFQKSWIHHFSTFPLSFPKHALAIELPLSLQIGSVELDAEEWGNLALGDALVLDKGSYDPKKQIGAATVTWQGIPLFQARIKHHKIELVEPASIHEATMTKKPKDSQALQQTPVVVTVELGRIQMPLEKLMQLSPGNFLELPVHPEQLVSLTVNGEVLAKGELVHLGETLSVRIISI